MLDVLADQHFIDFLADQPFGNPYAFSFFDVTMRICKNLLFNNLCVG